MHTATFTFLPPAVAQPGTSRLSGPAAWLPPDDAALVPAPVPLPTTSSPDGAGTMLLSDEAALETLVRAGRWADAARAAWEMRRLREAATYAWRAGLFFEAGACFLAAYDPTRAFNCLVRVPSEHPRYREACLRVVQIAAREGRVDARLDAFLGPWFVRAPLDEAETQALLELARLHARHGDVATAASVLAKVDGRSSATFVPADAPVEEVVLGSPADPDELESEESFQLLYNAGTTRMVLSFDERAGSMRDAEPPLDFEEPTSISTFGIGAVIANRYELLDRLGQGSMAVVFHARDRELDVDVALKLFKPSAHGDEADGRWRREAHVTRGLAHPNIVRVFDAGRTAKHRFLTMELLTGRDLASVLAETPRPPLHATLQMLEQLCRGLAYAHSHDVVHRDVKPGNLFVARDGTLKIMDFGIAKHVHAKGLTVTGQFMGTPEYMAPEQITDYANARCSVDLYAVGVVAFEMLVGQPPFTSNDMMQLLVQHVAETPPSPRAFDPSISPAMEDLVLRLLAKRPEDRFPSALAVAEEIERIKSSR